MSIKSTRLYVLTGSTILRNFFYCVFQRYRKDDEESNSDDDYVPYVPVRERKKQELLKLGRLSKVINLIIFLISRSVDYLVF